MSDGQSSNNSIDRLIDRERIRGASRMIPQGTEAKDVTAQQIADCRADVEALLRADKKLSGKGIARAIGYSAGVLSDFLANKYAGNNGELAIHLENWLVEEEQRRARPQTTQFVWTNVAMKIRSVASYCLDYKKIGLVYGPETSGLGKTMALQAIYQELGPRRCSLVSIDKVDANPTGILRKLCNAMRVMESGSNKQRFERIVEKLTGRSHLLLLDEIHSLRGAKEDKPFYILMNLYQRTETAQLWCGTADMVAYLQRQRTRGDESLAQICSRVFPRVDLMAGLRKGGGAGGKDDGLLVTVDQVREIFAKNRLKLTASAARFICELTNLPDSGCLRLCTQIIEYATAMGSKLTTLDVPALKEAMQLGLTSARADLLLHDHDEVQTKLMKVG